MNNSIYQKHRRWSDQYIPAMSQMAGEIMVLNNLLPIYFQSPNKAQDMREGIDMHVVTDKVTLAFRTRSSNYRNFYLETFTLRNPTELNKVMAGTYADYLLYALTNPKEPGQLESGILLDMKEVGWQLNSYPILLKNAAKYNDLIEFRYADFPDNVIAGLSSGLTMDDLIGWREVEEFVAAMTTGNSYAENVE